MKKTIYMVFFINTIENILYYKGMEKIMIFINSMYNQDAGAPIFPIEFIEDISKLKEDKDTIKFFDLNILVYNKFKDYKIYEQLKYIFGGYMGSPFNAKKTLINTYRYEALPTVELITYLIVSKDLNNENLLNYLDLSCKEYGLDFDYTLKCLENLTSCLYEYAEIVNSYEDEEVCLNVDSVSSVGIGLLFASMIDKKIVAIGNQINVPEIANYALTLGVIDEIKCPHNSEYIYNSEKFLEVLSQIKEYLYLYPLYYGLRIVPYKLTNGCPQKCNFCTERMFWTSDGKIIDSYKQKNLDDSMKEIEYLVEEVGVDGITFNDCMVDFSLPRYKRIVDYLVGNNVFCSGSTRVDCLSDEKVDILKKMNFTNLIIGLETFNKSSVSVYNKGKSNYLNNFEKTFNRLKESGIEPQINIVIDHPFENEKDVLNAIEEDKYSLEKMREHQLYILDLSVGEMLINYPSENYFNIMNNPKFNIEYHCINDVNINSNIKKAVNKIPYKAIANYETNLNKNILIDQVYKTMNYSADVEMRIATLIKHWKQLNQRWLKKDISIECKWNLSEKVENDAVLSMILNQKLVKYKKIIKNNDIQAIVTYLLTLYYLNIIDFTEGRGIRNEKNFCN